MKKIKGALSLIVSVLKRHRKGEDTETPREKKAT